MRLCDCCGITVISLFDGISCARAALDRVGVKVGRYFASEIDKYAIQVAHKNSPDTIHVGDVQELHCEESFLMVGEGSVWHSGEIDLVIGGSPCQDLSIAKTNRAGLQGERSGLFYEFVRVVRELKPKYFILENVNSMPKEAKIEISRNLFGIEPVMINASLVSAQNRKRLFWVGRRVGDEYERVMVSQPDDRGIVLNDILQAPGEVDSRMTVGGKAYVLTATYGRAVAWNSIAKKQRTMVRVGNIDGNNSQGYRKLTPIECERLQGLPDNYTDGISNTQRYKVLGNAFNVDVVAHILGYLKFSN
jgi:DNA-cytosine methyltransferase